MTARWFSALLLLFAIPMFGGDTPPRNWEQCPAVVVLKTTEVVYALGDTHGDYDRLVKLLVAGKLIAGAPASPEGATWSGGRSILVVTGGIGKFLLCLPFASRANGWFFAHAGSTKGRTLAQLIADLQKGVDEDGYGATVLLGNKGLLEARMKPPWWEKEGDTPIESEARLLGYADALSVKHIVFGHQPGTYTFNGGSTRKKGTMFENFDGLVFLIDVGMSRGVDYSKGALLRIERGSSGETATALFPDGSQKQLWP